MPNFRLGTASLAFCVLVAGCGGSDENPAPDNPDTGVPTIRSGSRLFWDQQAPSSQELGTYTYAIYVDGTRGTMSEIRCDPGSGGYVCSGRLPSMSAGRHTLEVSTFSASGAESSRSSGLIVMMASSLAPQLTNSESPAGDITRTTCLDSESRECFDVHVLASGLGEVTHVTPLADGRVLFVEDRRNVRVIADGALVAEPALTVNEGERIAGLAVETDFERGRTVYVASAAEGAGEDDATVTRFRELQNVLGEGAVIVSGLPIPKDADMPIAVDAEQRVYVAVPAFAEMTRTSRLAYNGLVLRFTRDGGAAGVDRTSPAFARAYEQPASLSFDGSERRLWIAGANAASETNVASVGVAREEPVDIAPVNVPARASAQETPSEMLGIAVVSDAAPSRARWLWVLRSTENPLRGILGARGRVLEWQTTELDLSGQILSVAQSSNGLIALLSSSPGKVEKPFSLVRLAPR